jgi:hypothetical protein
MSALAVSVMAIAGQHIWYYEVVSCNHFITGQTGLLIGSSSLIEVSICSQFTS